MDTMKPGYGPDLLVAAKNYLAASAEDPETAALARRDLEAAIVAFEKVIPVPAGYRWKRGRLVK